MKPVAYEKLASNDPSLEDICNKGRSFKKVSSEKLI